MSQTILKLSATLTAIQSKVDRSYVLKFNTQELGPLEVAELSQNLQQYGSLGFAVKDEVLEQLDHLEAPEEGMEAFEGKTPSQRLRDRMFVYYQDKFKKSSGFNTWYADTLDEIGQKYLAKVQS